MTSSLTRSGAADMQLFGLFAQQAAVAIAQSRALRNLTELVRISLADLDGAGDLAARLTDLAERTEQGAEYRDMVQLASLLSRLARTGEAGRRLGLSLVGTIVNYIGAPGTTGQGLPETGMVEG